VKSTAKQSSYGAVVGLQQLDRQVEGDAAQDWTHSRYEKWFTATRVCDSLLERRTTVSPPRYRVTRLWNSSFQIALPLQTASPPLTRCHFPAHSTTAVYADVKTWIAIKRKLLTTSTSIHFHSTWRGDACRSHQCRRSQAVDCCERVVFGDVAESAKATSACVRSRSGGRCGSQQKAQDLTTVGVKES